MQTSSDNAPQTPSPWKYSSVLLIDGNLKRQFERAASMRLCGLHVDCAADADTASGLWARDKYRLVLIELHGATDDLLAFSSQLQELSPPQKIGIYRSKPPFIVRAGDPLLRSADTTRLPRESVSEAPVKVGYGISHAAQRIRAMRPQRARVAEASPVPNRPKPESNTDIAARVLGGAE